MAKDPSKELIVQDDDVISSGWECSSDTEWSSVSSNSNELAHGSVKSLMTITSGQLRLSYESSALLRRPTIPDKYIRSTAKDRSSISIAYELWDKRYVAEKMT